jgi:gamma-glutamyl:cysteine ligase YbdK (ATP-grasp superfamily)
MSSAFHLFERVGVELEYMLVDRERLAVLPAADELLRAAAGKYTADVDSGELTWSNELVLHVIELKSTGPAASFDGLAEYFQRDVRRMNELLAPRGGQLMPTGMHPWMDPLTETKLWPHDCSPVYAAFDRIFNCKGHGWANLQSSHLNLPFCGDEEFGRLHAAIRLALPILPALAASSPIVDGHPTGVADTRLEVYRSNSRRIPSVAGHVIPEPVFTPRDYQERILQKIYRDLAPHDPEGILQEEWSNARGAIPRFERDTIEIRVLDIQECPQADLAILRLVVAVLRALVAERWTPFVEQCNWPVTPLEEVFLATIEEGDQAVVADEDYLRQFGLTEPKRCTAGTLWQHLAETVLTPAERESREFAPLKVILHEGCLARRILKALGGAPGVNREGEAPAEPRGAHAETPPGRPTEREQIAAVYRTLCACLAEGRMFHA